MKSFLRALCVALIVASPTTALAGSVAPDWLQALASSPPPPNVAKDAPAVVLLDETRIEIDAQGTAVETHRVAIRILRQLGSGDAIGNVYYNGTSDKVLDAYAWLVRAGKTEKSKPQSYWIDVAEDAPGAVIDETRRLQIDLTDFAVVGDVFGYETRVRQPLLVPQLRWNFGWRLPAQTERLMITLPQGFSIKAHSFDTIPPMVVADDHRTWTWTATDRPYRPDEPLAAAVSYLDGQLILTIVPPAGTRPFGLGLFSDWAGVGAVVDTLNAGQCDSSPELVATVQRLTAHCDGPLAKIRALGAYVQQLRYIAINQGLRYGNGYKARKASTVFATGYGDCKDKANLLRSMLNVAGLRSHRIEALAERAVLVHEECPTPIQFNHAILGIEVDSSIQLPSVVTTEKWGRLLIFDATDPETPVGDIPAVLQGTKVHIAENGGDSLITLPDFPAREDFRLERKVELALSPTGSVSVSGHVQGTGQTGARLRYELKIASRPIERNQLVTANLGDSFRGAVVQQQAADDDPISGRCALSFVCTHERFMQRFQGRTAVVKMDVLSRRLPVFSAPERRLPIELDPIAVDDEIVLNLPAGYAVDELPAAKSFESSYGSYGIHFETTGKTLIMKRSVVLNKMRVPAADYAALRQFLNDIARSDRTSVLLKQGS